MAWASRPRTQDYRMRPDHAGEVEDFANLYAADGRPLNRTRAAFAPSGKRRAA